MQNSQPNSSAPQSSAQQQQQLQQQQQQNLQRLIAMGAFPGVATLPMAGMSLPASFQQAQASQLQLQAALAQNPALQAQFAQQLQQQAILAQRASLAQPSSQQQGATKAVSAAPSSQIPATNKPQASAPAAGIKPSTSAPRMHPTSAAPSAGGKSSAPAPSKLAAAVAAAAAASAPASRPAASSLRQSDVVPARRAGHSGHKKRKVADTRPLDRVNQLVPESALFTAMQDAERRADLLITRKRSELQETSAAIAHTSTRPPGAEGLAGGWALRKKLRVYVFSEHFHQDVPAAAASTASNPEEPPSWCLHIQGRLIDINEVHTAAPQGKPPGSSRLPFTHYIRKLQVQLDPSQYPGSEGCIKWEKSRHDREHRDSFEVRRKGSRPLQGTLSLELDYQPQQYSVSPPLSTLLGLRGLHSLPFIMQQMWAYVRQYRLYQADQVPTIIRCDDKLREAFGGVDSVPLSDLQDTVRGCCKLPEAVAIQFVIRTDGPSPSHPDCYDFDFEVPLGFDLPSFAANPETEENIKKAELGLATILLDLQEHKRRHAFFLGFAHNPVDFINALIATQARELRVASSRDGESWEVLASGEVFKEKWAEDAVMRYLHRRMAGGVH